MTHQQEFLLVLLSLPVFLALGLFLGHFGALRYLAAGLHDKKRPKVQLWGKCFRLVTEADFLRLERADTLEDV